jgi:hypothetical protein
MPPAEGRNVGKQNIADSLALGTKLVNGARKIDGIPKGYGRYHKIQA